MQQNVTSRFIFEYSPIFHKPRGYGRIDFYLSQVMSGHGAFITGLLHMKLAESPECSNCDNRGRDDNAWHTLFGCLALQLFREDVMTTLQEMSEEPLTPGSLVSIMVRSAKGWEQVAAFVILTMHHKMELAHCQLLLPPSTRCRISPFSLCLPLAT